MKILIVVCTTEVGEYEHFAASIGRELNNYSYYGSYTLNTLSHTDIRRCFSESLTTIAVRKHANELEPSDYWKIARSGISTAIIIGRNSDGSVFIQPLWY
jgi:hypothetical protein